MNLTEKSIDVRIEATREAQMRSRIALAVMTVASLVIIVAEYNVCYSWARGYAEFARAEDEKTSNPSPSKVLRDLAVQEWVKRQSVTVTLLGVNIGADDLPILGPLALIPMYVWFIFCLRSEFLAIGLLLRCPEDFDEPQRKEWGWLVYYAIASFGVLSDFNESLLVKERETASKSSLLINFPFQLIFTILIFIPCASIITSAVMDAIELNLLVPVFSDFDPAKKSLWANLTWKEACAVWRYRFVQLLSIVAVLSCATEANLLRWRSEQVLSEHLNKLMGHSGSDVSG